MSGKASPRLVGAWLKILTASLLAVATSTAVRHAGQPLLDFHAFRKTQTALTSFWIMEEGPRLAYRTPVSGYPWSIPFEFPLYQMIAAAVAKAGHLDFDAVGRLLSFAVFWACAWPAAAVVERLKLPKATAWFFCALLWSSPLYLFWGASLTIETAALFVAFAAVPCALVQGPSTWRSAWICAMSGSLAAPQKITKGATVVMGKGIVWLWTGWISGGIRSVGRREVLHVADLTGVFHVGVDEMNRRPGHNYLAVFAVLAERRILFAPECNDHPTFETVSEETLRHDGRPHAIWPAAMEMSATYHRGMAEVIRNVEAVCDPFHETALDEARRKEARTGGTEAGAALKGSINLFRENPENLTPRQAEDLDRPDLKNLEIRQAYRARLEPGDIYRKARSPKGARYRLRALIYWAGEEGAMPCVAGASRQVGEDDQGPFGRDPDASRGRAEHRFHGVPGQCLQCRETHGPWISLIRIPHHPRHRTSFISRSRRTARSHESA